MCMREWTYKGRLIKPYETFYRGDSERFFRGIIGDGISRSVKCDDSLAILVEYEGSNVDQH